MQKFRLTKLYMALALIVSLASCTSDFEDINTSPNAPTEVPSTNILAYTLENFTVNAFNTTAINIGELGYSNQIGKIQYPEESIYEFREGTFNSFFTTVYRNQQNLDVVMAQAEAAGASNMLATAKTWSAYIWLIATDMWRNIPFTEAMNAVDGTLSPAYDTQEEIYPAVMTMLEEANTLFNEGSSDAIGAGDFLFEGDAEAWQKFANSLRLRMAIRISNVDPTTAQSVIEQILGSPETYPIISSNDDNAYYHWLGTDPYYEPFYTNKEVDARDDHAVAEAMVDYLADLADPRLPVYAHPGDDGEYRGVEVGVRTLSNDLRNYSRIGARFRDDAAGFSPFMNYAEVCFIIAEASANGWATGTTAAEAYEAGITASMEENEVAADDIAAYLAQPEVAYSNDVDQIYLQKWIALFKNGHEAWAENRRTDVPLLAPAPDGAYAGHNRPPFRQPYPNDEINLNEANIREYWDLVTDRMWGQKMYWDTRTGVN